MNMKNHMTYSEQLAWAAGFIDGEGYIRCRGESDSGTFCIHVAQTDKFVLHRLKKIFKGGKIYGPYSHKNKENHKPYFVYSISSREAIKAFNKIRLFLSKVKRQQGDKALEEWRSLKATNRLSQNEFNIRLNRIKKAFEKFNDPLIGTIGLNGRLKSKASLFAHKRAKRYRVPHYVLYHIIKKHIL
jgi:hypothetical protein